MSNNILTLVTRTTIRLSNRRECWKVNYYWSAIIARDQTITNGTLALIFHSQVNTSTQQCSPIQIFSHPSPSLHKCPTLGDRLLHKNGQKPFKTKAPFLAIIYFTPHTPGHESRGCPQTASTMTCSWTVRALGGQTWSACLPSRGTPRLWPEAPTEDTGSCTNCKEGGGGEVHSYDAYIQEQYHHFSTHVNQCFSPCNVGL